MILYVLSTHTILVSMKVVENKCEAIKSINCMIINWEETHLFSTTFILLSLNCMSNTWRNILISTRRGTYFRLHMKVSSDPQWQSLMRIYQVSIKLWLLFVCSLLVLWVLYDCSLIALRILWVVLGCPYDFDDRPSPNLTFGFWTALVLELYLGLGGLGLENYIKPYKLDSIASGTY